MAETGLSRSPVPLACSGPGGIHSAREMPPDSTARSPEAREHAPPRSSPGVDPSLVG